MYDLAHAHEVWPIPSRFRTCTPAQWAAKGKVEHDLEWTVAKGWLSQFPRFLETSPFSHLHGHGLALVGETGVGKTMLACSFLNYLRGKGFSTAFVRDGDLYQLLMVRYPDDEQTDLLGYLQRSACVVIDDLGYHDRSVETVEPFLRYRMDEAKPTIVTMNTTVALTARMESLLHEFTYVVFTGTDLRKSPLEPDHARW